jgi:cobalamin biosynthesis Mg chelatase CobN
MFGPAEQQQQQPQAEAEQQQQQEQQQQNQPQQQQQQQKQVPGRRGVRRPGAPADANSSGAAVQQQQQQGGSGSRPSTPAAVALPGRDVRECLDEERMDILAGCRIVFSRWVVLQLQLFVHEDVSVEGGRWLFTAAVHAQTCE